MNVTLSIDRRVLERARRIAEQRGSSVNQMIRDYFARVTSNVKPDQVIAQLDRTWAGSKGHSRGRRWTREELHERSRVR